MDGSVMSDLVTVDRVAVRLGDPRLVVVDTRYDVATDARGRLRGAADRQGYLSGHLPGAVFLDLDTLRDCDDPTKLLRAERFAEVMGRLGIGGEATVVCYDDAGGLWAARLWWALRRHGHDAVAVLDGGLNSWVAAGLPLERGESVATPRRFRARPRDDLVVTKEDVLAVIEDPDVLVVDALPEPYHSGTLRLYPTLRSGHVPGSQNLPAPRLLDAATGRVLDRDRLAAAWREVGLTPGKRVVTYCGGGVYGAFDLLTLTLLGHRDAALYDGSWEEWGADPVLPVATESAS